MTPLIMATLASCLMAAPGMALAEKITIAIGGSGQSLQGQTAKRFADGLQERLGDDYQVEYYDSGQLGDEKQLVQKLRLKTVDMAAISTVMSSVVPAFALFDLPYLINDRQQMQSINDELVMTELAERARKRGLVPVSTWENGFRQITNNRRAINTPADLKGLKIRVPPSEWRSMMFTQWGANPTPMAFSEVFVGLQTGVIDGQENPLTNIYGARLHEVQNYLSMTNHVYSPIWLMTGLQWWDKQPEEVRQAIQEEAQDAQRWAFKRGQEMDEELLERFEAEGIRINEVDREAFIDASQPVYERFASQVEGGESLIDRARGAEGQQ
ncbi:TRAP transporter substrate-binding protein [Kushneria pakistanensis]|nr:TRAP transporter substrate-binding protein [Kushneria pakistanensis]